MENVDSRIRLHKVEVMIPFEDPGHYVKRIKDGQWSVLAFGEDELKDHDTSLLEKGYTFDYYDQYSAYYHYVKLCDQSIFDHMVITLKIPCINGTTTEILSGCFPLEIPKELRSIIMKAINEEEEPIIVKECYLNQIVDYFGMENLVKWERLELESYTARLRKALYLELIRQKEGGIASHEELLKVYRKNVRFYPGIAFCLYSKMHDESESAIKEAEALLSDLEHVEFMAMCHLLYTRIYS